MKRESSGPRPLRIGAIAGHVAPEKVLAILYPQPDAIEESRSRLSDAVRNEELDGYILLRPDDAALARGQYYARETGNIIINETIEGALERAILEESFCSSCQFQSELASKLF